VKAKLLNDEHGQKTFAVIFDTGDSVVPGLLAFAREEKLAASHFTAIGAFQDLVLGYFDWEQKQYKPIPVREQVEVVSLVGDIAEDEKGGPKIHAHVVVGRSDGSAMAGHLIEARVRPTLELMLTESPQRLQRKYDPDSGLALIRF
jgi:predicted DNA-binding protein with PD1-like motif